VKSRKAFKVLKRPAAVPLVRAGFPFGWARPAAFACRPWEEGKGEESSIGGGSSPTAMIRGGANGPLW
jgi:hypothetical protein